MKVSHKTIKHLLTVLKLTTIMLIEQYCVIYFRLLKEITKSCDELEQVNSG